MKRNIFIIVIILLAVFVLAAGCANKGDSMGPGFTNGKNNIQSDSGAAPSGAPASPGGIPAGGGSGGSAAGNTGAAPPAMNSPSYTSGISSSAKAEAQSDYSTDLSQKIIYNARAEIETLEFDNSLSDVYSLLDMYGAFIESSSITGRNYSSMYYKMPIRQTATITLRVPAHYFNDLTTRLSSLGNVISLNTNSDNITAQFFDSESRLNTYKIEEERLFTMLSKAETVEEMLLIEERISNVRYHIESLSSTLRNWQNEVDFSTVTITLYEVEELTELEPEPEPEPRTYWQQTGDGLVDVLNGIAVFFKELFKYIIILLPVLVIIAIIIAALIILRIRKKRRNSGD
jgi:hypothetical protein